MRCSSGAMRRSNSCLPERQAGVVYSLTCRPYSTQHAACVTTSTCGVRSPSLPPSLSLSLLLPLSHSYLSLNLSSYSELLKS
jgi:hypothetical protein